MASSEADPKDELSSYYAFDSTGKRKKNKWDSFDVDAELAKLDDSDDDAPASRARPKPPANDNAAPGAPNDGAAAAGAKGGGGGGGGALVVAAGAKGGGGGGVAAGVAEAEAGRELIHRFFEFAMGTVNVSMSSFFEQNIDLFDDLDDVGAKGESLEQWDVYQVRARNSAGPRRTVCPQQWGVCCLKS